MMSKIFTATRLLKNPGKLVAPMAERGFFNWLSDENFIKLRYYTELGYRLNLDNPKSFNEKIQWLKLYNRNPEYIKIVDKYQAKYYVGSKIGFNHIIPTYHMYDTFEEIDFSTLPDQFVLKCTHDSGSVYICKNKDLLDKDKAKKVLEKGLRHDPTRYGREWIYAHIKPRIIDEKYMVDESGFELKDYKVFTCGGKAKMIQVDFGRFNNHQRNLYSIDLIFNNGTIKYPNNPKFIIENIKT